jgi:endo-1,4-beta-mannosidase
MHGSDRDTTPAQAPAERDGRDVRTMPIDVDLTDPEGRQPGRETSGPIADLEVGAPFRVGINYWPRRKAMGWWKAFDEGEVAGEFDVIADLGLRLVRVFLLWEDIQPTPEAISPAVLADLQTVCDLAEERGLGLDVTFFTGHMSGPNWAPPWLLGGSEPVPDARQVVSGPDLDAGSYRNPFVDPVAVRAAELQLRTVVGRLRHHPAIWAWNLGNEPDLFAHPPDAIAGPDWARRLFAVIRELDEVHHVTVGLHAPSLVSDNGLRVDRLFSGADMAAMHAYPIYANFGAQPLEPDAVPFATALTAVLSGRPTLMEEFGACTAPPGQGTTTWEWQALGRTWRQVMLSEEALAEHLAEVLPRLVEVGARGALLWCFADYDESLWGRPPCDTMLHERHFGLLRPDGTPKPHAEVVRRFIASAPVVSMASPRARFEVDGDAFYADPAAASAELFQRFRAAP